jgi:triphosphatase
MLRVGDDGNTCRLINRAAARRLRPSHPWMLNSGSGTWPPPKRLAIEPSKGTVSPRQGVQELASALSARRASAFANAKRAIASPRYQRFAFETLEWMEIGNWAKHSDAARGRAVKRFAKDMLTQRTIKVMKKGKKLKRLNPGQRHKLRIALKKLRYTTEFFESLFKGSTAAKHRLEFQGHLKDLQDGLGALNDITVHQQMATRSMGHNKKPAPAFAAGVVSGREQSEIEPLLKGAHAAARKFAQARFFWS